MRGSDTVLNVRWPLPLLDDSLHVADDNRVRRVEIMVEGAK